MPGLRIIGYRRAVSIVLAVEDEQVLILGILSRRSEHPGGIAGTPPLNRCSVRRGCR